MNPVIEVTSTAQRAGIRFPVFLTRAVWEAYVTVPPGVEAQDEQARLWAICTVLRYAIVCNRGRLRMLLALYVRNTNTKPKLVTLAAECRALSAHDQQPAITVRLVDEA